MCFVLLGDCRQPDITSCNCRVGNSNSNCTDCCCCCCWLRLPKTE
ncbi:hypothetical protein AB205_0078460 [Aquarana catesbeiana]|uniref:Uncharacterized protein n=1 Tax=Aquarana catesbeiana TaxID=8400 RepID=A0A2G9SCY4_AQUCT|nr:hypothetical protein AB205_0078460 [Aquarana catesbeiana]